MAVFAAKTGKYHMARTALEESLWNNQPQLFNTTEAGQETNPDSPSKDVPKPQVKTINHKMLLMLQGEQASRMCNL